MDSARPLTVSPPKSLKGKQLLWRDLDSMAAVMATVRLPDASINGSKQKRTDWHNQLKKEFDRLYEVLTPKFSELNNVQKGNTWKSRSGRSVAEQGAKCLATCRKLKGCVRIFESSKVTGNPTDNGKFRCAIALYNNIIKVSHFYDVLRNPNYVTGKPFPYMHAFEWLDQTTDELDPTLEVSEGNNNDNRADDVLEMDGSIDNGGAENRTVTGEDIATDPMLAVKEDSILKEGRKRPIGVKAAKALKKARQEAEGDDDGIKNALESWTKGFAEASSASIAAANARANIDDQHSNREYELRKEAAELEAVRILFNDDDIDSRRYRKVLKKKRLRKILNEEPDSDLEESIEISKKETKPNLSQSCKQ